MAAVRMKNAIVTGASGGIGRVVAQRLARDASTCALDNCSSKRRIPD